jgi:hypothetical protein
MTMILHSLAKLLRAIVRGLEQTAYMGLCGPIPWPRESGRDRSTRDPR